MSALRPDIQRRVKALFQFLAHLYGADNLVLKARKLNALKFMCSSRLGQQLLALQRLVFEDPTLAGSPRAGEALKILDRLEEQIADLVARRTVEESLDEKIAAKLRERYLEYLRELRLEALKDDQVETSTTMERLAHLDLLEQSGLATSALTFMRPRKLSEVVGQEAAVESLLAKIGTDHPQHVLLYGPSGVGKTTVARLVLEKVRGMAHTPFREGAPFVEVDATTLRWDPREITNPLIGSVHDPIYQGSRRDLAEAGIPEPKTGLVTQAHGGVLFIDEIGELDPILQNKLLKVLEDKRVTFESSYYDENDPRVPQYIHKLFRRGAPADFILIGATTRPPEDISPAIRSRCAEVFFSSLSATHLQEIVRRAAARLKVKLADEVPEIISRYTVDGRKAVQLLTDAYGRACLQGRRKRRGRVTITAEDAYAVIRTGRLSAATPVRASSEPEVGRTYGLGVSGFVGTCLEVEAACFSAREPGRGGLRFNEAAGHMARDSVFNAASVIRKLLDRDLADYDIHVNVVGGGKIDGPSAGLPVVLAIISALEDRPLRPDLAATGELSIQGKVRPVGGITEKIQGAARAGMKRVLIPWDNRHDSESDGSGVEVIPVATVAEALEYAWG